MKKTATASYYSQLLNKINEYIIINTKHSFGIRQLADECCVSKNHLADLFSLVQKTSLGNYIAAKKTEQAASLYYFTSLNLDEIAGLTGFATKHSLSKAISNHFEMSPGKLKKTSLYRADSPNIIIDGIRSADTYDYLLRMNVDYSFTTREFYNTFLVGVPLPVIANGVPDTKTYKQYLNDLADRNRREPAGKEIFAYPLDSINFGRSSLFRMVYGVIHSGTDYDTLKQQYPYSMVIPVPDGKYISFQIRGDAIPAFEHEITFYRENIIAIRKDFQLTDFFAFYTYSPRTKKHSYLVYHQQ